MTLARVGVRMPGMTGALWPPFALPPSLGLPGASPGAGGIWVPLLKPTSIQTGPAYGAQADDLVLVDLAASLDGVNVAPPTPAMSRMFAVKIIGATGGHSVTINSGDAQIDGGPDGDTLSSEGESAIYVCGPGAEATWSWWRVG